MKTYPLSAITLCLFLFCQSLVRAQDMDSAITKLTDDLAAKISAKLCKRVSVADFTDLEHNPTEIGKYIADQVTVDFAMQNRDFSVLDRAHLKKIMDENKMSASGLVDPDTAKHLGMLAGVDALIFGIVTPIGNSVSVTVQVIATDTGTVFTAGKARFQQDDSIQKLLAQGTKPDDSASTGDSPPAAKPPPPPKPMGDLNVKVDSFDLVLGDRMYGYANFAIVISNSSQTDTYGVALMQSGDRKLNLTSSRGDDFYVTDLTGIDFVFNGYNGYQGTMTDVLPGSSITITGKSQVQWNGSNGDYRPYRLQAMTVFSTKVQGRYPNLQKYNVVLNIP